MKKMAVQGEKTDGEMGDAPSHSTSTPSATAFSLQGFQPSLFSRIHHARHSHPPSDTPPRRPFSAPSGSSSVGQRPDLAFVRLLPSTSSSSKEAKQTSDRSRSRDGSRTRKDPHRRPKTNGECNQSSERGKEHKGKPGLEQAFDLG